MHKSMIVAENSTFNTGTVCTVIKRDLCKARSGIAVLDSVNE